MRAEEALAIAKSYTKKTVEGAGAIQGQDGVSPVITENAGNNEDTYKLDITDVNGTFTTPNLKGQGGDGSTGTTDHNDLINRDAADQHPISAITGLEEALEVKQDKLSDEQLQNIDDVVNKANSIDVYSKDVADTTFIKAAEKAQANGVATLNNMGVIPSEQVNISSLNVKGTWDASTNTPALVNGVGTSGDFYITSVAGAVDFGAGEISFSVGDWALYTDSGVWEKSVNASAVQSVNGKTGLVNILDTDVLNEDQLKAVNSGITEEGVLLIETNKILIEANTTAISDLQDGLETKLDKTTDVSNAGKVLTVGDDGAIGFGEVSGKTYTALEELGLDASATLNDAIGAMPPGSSALFSVTSFTDYQNLFPYTESNDQYARVYIAKGAYTAYIYVVWFMKNGSKYAIANVGNNNTVIGWNNILTQKSDPYACSIYKVLTGTEDLFTLAPGHYASANVDTAYNYPITDASNVLAHIYVIGHLNDPANNKGYRIILYFDNKNRMYRINEWWGSFSNGWVDVSSKEIIHTDLSGDLAGTTTTLDLINKMITEFRAKAKPVRFVSGNLTKTNLTDLPEQYGVLDITVTGYDVVKVSFAASSFGFKKMYYGYVNRTSSETLFSSISWGQVDTNTKSLVTNSATFTIDITKKNASWYCPFKFTYMYGTSVCEIDFALTTYLSYTTKGPTYIDSITYTIDGANIKIGIKFSATMYGTQIVSFPSECGTINALTKDEFTGATKATYRGGYAIKSYLSISELGLDTTATINDILNSMVDGSMYVYKTDAFNYATHYLGLQYATVSITKHSANRVQLFMTDKDTGDLYVGKFNSTNTFAGWTKVCVDSTSTPTTVNMSSVSGYASGTIKYVIKNGICYVGIRDLKATESTTFQITMPKALLTVSQQFGQLGGSSVSGMCYIEEGSTTMMITGKTAPLSANFSYPVA